MVMLKVESSFWNNSVPLSTAVDCAQAYANHKDFQISIVKVLIEKCLLANSCGLVEPSNYESKIITAAEKIIIIIGDTVGDEDMAQCASSGIAIYINGGWMAKIQKSYESRQHSERKYKVHLVLLIVKLLHELIHSFTPRIMVSEHEVRVEAHKSDNSVPTNFLDKTSTKVGYKHHKKGCTKLGDMGFCGEELLSQAGVRFYFKPFSKSSCILWDFTDLLLWKYKEDLNSFHQCSMMNEDSFLSAVTASHIPKLDDFRVILAVTDEVAKKQTKKRKVESGAVDEGTGANDEPTIKRASAQLYTGSDSEDTNSSNEEFALKQQLTTFSTTYGICDSGDADKAQRKN